MWMSWNSFLGLFVSTEKYTAVETGSILNELMKDPFLNLVVLWFYSLLTNREIIDDVSCLAGW